MESHEVVKSCLAEMSPKELARELGVSVSLVYKWSQPTHDQHSGALNPLDRANQLDAVSKDHAVARWMAEKADGFFLPNPPVEEEARPDYVTCMNQLVREFASLLSTVTQAAGDERISRIEAESIRQRWDELKADTEGFVAACERGDYASISQQALDRCGLKRVGA
ncbi:MAG: hypothetical protein E1N59_360 [Puniceicoccaceae bacterium 5H]|nr:MAG: hypothetical protein E1N59_360 [Puniceicoccaceae bacterium 5H]